MNLNIWLSLFRGLALISGSGALFTASITGGHLHLWVLLVLAVCFLVLGLQSLVEGWLNL
jgi:hypothetical protein